ncbi:MAG: D-2-hydroxyacid dehydrogenase [Eubacteriales bacterium]|jgi:phosphoglycerate dehydrogenase-like enzyme
MKVVVALPVTEEQKRILGDAAPSAEFVYSEPDHVTADEVRDADVLVGMVQPEICRCAEKVKWYQANAAGPDKYRKPGVFSHEVTITSAVGAYGPSVGEHMLALTLAAQKNLGLYRDQQSERIWKDAGPAGTLYQATVLVLGIGDIGQTYARYCSAMGARVIGFRRHVGEVPEGVSEVCTMDRLDEWIPRADVIAMVLPGGDSTWHIMNADRIHHMKKTAVLVNCGRGTAVDCGALAEALHNGQLAGAALDVTEPEPLPADHPLWSEPRAIITPHVAGFFHIPETMNRIIAITAENLQHFQKGEPMRNVMS